jgi:hypothetical protein
MSFISTSDPKSDSSNLIEMSAPPPSIIILTIISLLIAISMMAVSVANIGMSAMWSNSMVAGLDLLYHIVFLIVVFIHRKNYPFASEHHTEGADDKRFDYFDMAPLKPPSIAFSEWNITSLFFLLAVNFIAFSVMTNNTTILGAMGGRPVESLQERDFKIQVTLQQLSLAVNYSPSQRHSVFPPGVGDVSPWRRRTDHRKSNMGSEIILLSVSQSFFPIPYFLVKKYHNFDSELAGNINSPTIRVRPSKLAFG